MLTWYSHTLIFLSLSPLASSSNYKHNIVHSGLCILWLAAFWHSSMMPTSPQSVTTPTFGDTLLMDVPSLCLELVLPPSCNQCTTIPKRPGGSGPVRLTILVILVLLVVSGTIFVAELCVPWPLFGSFQWVQVRIWGCARERDILSWSFFNHTHSQ